MCKCPFREIFPVCFSRGLWYLTHHLSVCSAAGFPQQPKHWFLLLFSAASRRWVHRSVSAPSWAGLCTEPKRGAVARESHAGANQCLCPLCPFLCLSVGPRFMQDRNLCVTQPLKESECSRFVFPSPGTVWVGSFPLNVACGPGRRTWQVPQFKHLLWCSWLHAHLWY